MGKDPGLGSGTPRSGPGSATNTSRGLGRIVSSVMSHISSKPQFVVVARDLGVGITEPERRSEASCRWNHLSTQVSERAEVGKVL
ncbi:hypothetical protein H8959_016236 [Pygathrix nigripes]